MQHPRVIVLGAGIVGAAIAYHLARQGAQVTVLEQDTPGSGVTRHSFAWINPHGEYPSPVKPLREQALTEYRRLEQELPGLRINWSGALCYYQANAMQPTAMPCGSTRQWLDRQRIAQLEPNLQAVPEHAQFAPGEGSLDPVATTLCLLEGARAHGAQVLTQVSALELQVDGQQGIGVATAAGVYQADHLVLATGCGTPALLESLGIELPMHASPSILLRLDAPRGLVKTLISNDQLEVRETPDGSLLAAEDHLDDATPEAIAQQALASIRQALRGAEAVTLRSVEVGQRPMPDDQVPIIGPLAQYPGLYLAVMHAGVTLAPIVGRLVSQELSGHSCAELEPCRPSRFGL